MVAVLSANLVEIARRLLAKVIIEVAWHIIEYEDVGEEEAVIMESAEYWHLSRSRDNLMVRPPFHTGAAYSRMERISFS